MARNGNKQNKSSTTDYKIEYVTITRDLVPEMERWRAYDQTEAFVILLEILDQSWKVSCSLHNTTGRYLVSLTYKGSLHANDGIVYIFEHDIPERALWAAAFHVANDLIGYGEVSTTGVYDW